MIARVLLALLVVEIAGAASAASQEEARARRAAPVAVAEVLLRSPREWPAADAERWRDWSAALPPPASIGAPLAQLAQSYARGDLVGALEAIYELLEREPGYPPALHQAGVIYFRLRRYGDAALAFERYLEVAPGRAGDTRALGHCLYTLGDYERARAHYERVLAAEPESAEALRGLALSHMRLGANGRALELLRRVVELDPSHANARAWIAQILHDEERLDEALEEALRARELAPFEPRPWFLLSRIFFELGRDEEGEDAHARFTLLARIDQEVRALEARLLYDPRQPELLERLGALHREAGNLAELRRALLRQVALRPADVALRMRALEVLWAMGDAEGAADAARSLESVGADHAAAWRLLATYYAVTRERVKQVQAEVRYSQLRERDGE